MVEFIVHKLVHEGVRMVNNLRSPEIIKLANQRSILRVEELAKYFNVSVQTIKVRYPSTLHKQDLTLPQLSIWVRQ